MPRLHRIPRGWPCALLVAASTAFATPPGSAALTEDVHWACRQPEVAHVRLLQVMVEEPDGPCVAIGSTPERCNVVKARAAILDALPLVGASKGLERTQLFNSAEPNQVEVRLTNRNGLPVSPPPFDAVTAKGLLALQTLPDDGYGSAQRVPTNGVFIPLQSGTEFDLDRLCRPVRPWSGQKQPMPPEQLPGDYPARTEDVTALARRLAGVVQETPPDVASLERRFGSRMLAVRPPTAEQSDDRGLAQLQSSWVRIERKTWSDVRGTTTQLALTLTPAHAKDRAVPWWDSDPSDTVHRVGDCVRPSMVMNALEPHWPMDRRGPPYDQPFDNASPHYTVRILFAPHGMPPHPYAQRNVTDQCLDRMFVRFEPR